MISLPQASQSWCNWVRFVGRLARTHFFSSAHNFSMGLRSGLCDGHSNTLTLLSLSHFATTLDVCLVSLSIWKTHLRPSFNFLPDWCLEMLLQYIHIISFPHDAIYYVKSTSPSCSNAPPQHDAATPVLHGWDGFLRLASFPLFPPNMTMFIMAKQFCFYLIRPEDISTKVQSLSPCAVANFFYSGFGAVASSLLSGLSG